MTNNNNKVIAAAYEYVFKFVQNEGTGHDIHHAMRVLETSMRLAENYDVDIQIIALAALLHDLDDYKVSEGTNRARQFLTKNCPQKEIQIMEIIDTMSFSSHKLGKKVVSIEGQIVQDADRLDALGAIGIARCFAYSGKTSRPLYNNVTNDNSAIAHFYEKLLDLEKLMNTDKARIIAK